MQLPFLQMLFDDFTLLPLVLGSIAPEHVAAALAQVWGDAATLVLVSSDLSHYHSYEEARQIDAVDQRVDPASRDDARGEQACGAVGINGLLYLARAAAARGRRDRALQLRRHRGRPIASRGLRSIRSS